MRESRADLRPLRVFEAVISHLLQRRYANRVLANTNICGAISIEQPRSITDARRLRWTAY